MKKFLVLYMMPAAAMQEMMKTMTPEAQAKSMEEWKTWMQANMASFVDAGAPLGKNVRATKDTVSQISNEVGGYSIVQAESAEEAAKMMQSGPHHSMPDFYTEVMEILPMP